MRLEHYNARGVASGVTQVMEFGPNDLEEMVARCGWTILNNLDNLTDDDRTAVVALERKGYAELPERTADEHIRWWRARLVGEYHPAPAQS